MLPKYFYKVAKELSSSPVVICDPVIEIKTDFRMTVDKTRDKLEEYRRKKLQAESQENRKQFLWDLVTLQPVRRRFVGNNRSEATVDDSGDKTDNDEPDTEDSEEEIRPWTSIDWAICFVKFLVWMCLQVIFVKIEFGSVFFLVSCILFMTSNLGKRKKGEASAYSVFNKNCEEIDGTFSAQQFDNQLRRGAM